MNRYDGNGPTVLNPPIADKHERPPFASAPCKPDGRTKPPEHRPTNLSVTLCTLLMVGLGCGLSLWYMIIGTATNWENAAFPVKMFTILLNVISLYFILSNLIFQVCRCVCAARERSHQQVGFSELNPYLKTAQGRSLPRVAILVPSYKEEIDVIRQTLLSAAFQACPNRRIVLLLDDPSRLDDPHEQRNRDLARALPGEISALLAAPLARVEAERERFDRAWTDAVEQQRAARELSRLWSEAADWFEQLALQFDDKDNTQALIRDRIILTRAIDLREHAAMLWHSESGKLNLWDEYRRLRDLFSVQVSVFERKRFANLSHAPNKAMNLNAYLHLIGKTWNEVRDNGRCLMHITEDGSGSHHEEDAEYVIVLDADSLLTPDYADQLIDFMEHPAHADVAIVQSPYAAIPNPTSYLERIAGAQTDAMYWSHQGLTAFGAGSWVGAAALLRMRALREVAEVDVEQGHPVVRYVKDRTVTEDADTTLDLLLKGWRVYNYPQRLNYSATPKDFGAFLVQRRRWATGGILIVPKLVRYLRQSPSPRRLLEVILRFHYLLSGTIGGVAMLLAIVYPSPPPLDVPIALIGALLLLAAAEVIGALQLGCRKRDFFGLYALNLFLIPINLSGAWHSVRQLMTGRRGSFHRTPKVSHRTATPRHHVLAQCFVLAAFAYGAMRYALAHADWPATFVMTLGAACMSFGFLRFIGLRNAWNDLTNDRCKESRAQPSTSVFADLCLQADHNEEMRCA